MQPDQTRRRTAVEPCRHGANCHRFDAEHLEKFAHPPGSEAQAALDHIRRFPDFTLCKWGRRCEDQSPEHTSRYVHFCPRGTQCPAVESASGNCSVKAPSDDRFLSHLQLAIHESSVGAASSNGRQGISAENASPMTDVRAFAADYHALLDIHRRSRRVARKESAGGIMPIAIDPATLEAHFLLGLAASRKNPQAAPVLCHFHGWIDEGETVAMGVAREGWEESKGAYADIDVLWRAVVASDAVRHLAKASAGGRQRRHDVANSSTPPPAVFAVPFSTAHCYLMLLGRLDETGRQAITQRFAAAPAYYSCMDECLSLHWIPASAIKTIATAGLNGRDDDPATVNARSQFETAVVAAGCPPGTTLRGFVGKWLSSDEMRQRVWPSQALDRLLFGGDPSGYGLLALTDMPSLTAPAAGATPSLRERLCEALRLPVCSDCGAVGHRRVACAAASTAGDTSSRRWNAVVSIQRRATSGKLRGRLEDLDPHDAAALGLEPGTAVHVDATALDAFVHHPSVGELEDHALLAALAGTGATARVPVTCRVRMVDLERLGAFDLQRREDPQDDSPVVAAS